MTLTEVGVLLSEHACSDLAMADKGDDPSEVGEQHEGTDLQRAVCEDTGSPGCR